jgi:cation:H+ antiporter
VGVVVALPVFVVALVVTLGAATTFARRLDQLGARFGLSEVSIGLLTAIAADAPEISSALGALIKGAHDASVGVIVGSNTFNLAAMLGVSVLVAGCVQVSRRTLLLEGTVSLAVTAIVIGLLLGWLPVAPAVALIALFVGPYLVLVLGGYDLARRLRLGRLAKVVLERDAEIGVHDQRQGAEFATRQQLAMMAVDLVLILAGSFGMVQAALTLGDRWGVAPGLVGALILGPLTSLPNALTGIRLGLRGRGAALVTEALNSNSINLVAGVALPSMFVVLTARSGQEHADLALLGIAMLATIGLLAARGGMERRGATIIIALYAAFVAAALS